MVSNYLKIMKNSIKIADLPVVILAGGLGTRISENKGKLPKALVKIGNKPILYHLIRYFSYFGSKKFIICIGYKGKLINNYFRKNAYNKNYKNLDIKLIYTGLNSNTGLRIKKIEKEIKSDFFLTYCDGLTNLNLKKLLKVYKNNKKIGVLTSINPQSRFGILSLKGNQIYNFDEKKKIYNLWVNAGFYIFNKKIFKFIRGNNPIFEKDTLKRISKKKLVITYKHKGFWKCMDTIKDKNELNKIWYKKPPWKFWK